MARRLLTFVVSATCMAAQTVVGTVVDAATGAGIGGVKVELLKGGTPFYETSTDAGGVFLFDGVREADYAARYQSLNYWLAAGPSDYRYFHVGPGDPVKLSVRLMPWSRIAGRVLDAKGNGIAGAQLALTGSGMVVNGRTYVRTSWGGGGGGQLSTSPLRMAHSGKTDAQGRFEVQVMPGPYELCAAPPPDFRPPDSEPGGPALAWKRTCSPGMDITILPGGEVSNVELRLVAVPVHIVRGVLLNPDGTPAPKVTIRQGDLFRPASVESKPDGTFEFSAVQEGESPFWAEVQRGSVKLRASERIDVPRHDLENVRLQLMEPLTVRGKVVTEAPKDAPRLRPGPLVLTRRSGSVAADGAPGPLDTAPAMPDANGDFVLQDVYPGLYRLERRLQLATEPYYLDAVRAGEADLMTQDVQFASDVQITVVYKANGGAVGGVAENCVSGGVLLVPRDPVRRLAGFSRSGPCDANGHYEVTAVRPGDYYALAIAGNSVVPAIDDALLSDSVKVTVRAGEASIADLKAITKPIY
jgi:Carboxypeptidase regulatory-like domain